MNQCAETMRHKQATLLNEGQTSGYAAMYQSGRLQDKVKMRSDNSQKISKAIMALLETFQIASQALECRPKVLRSSTDRRT